MCGCCVCGTARLRSCAWLLDMCSHMRCICLTMNECTPSSPDYECTPSSHPISLRTHTQTHRVADAHTRPQSNMLPQNCLELKYLKLNRCAHKTSECSAKAISPISVPALLTPLLTPLLTFPLPCEWEIETTTLRAGAYPPNLQRCLAIVHSSAPMCHVAPVSAHLSVMRLKRYEAHAAFRLPTVCKPASLSTRLSLHTQPRSSQRLVPLPLSLSMPRVSAACHCRVSLQRVTAACLCRVSLPPVSASCL
jgi:hypothetical protein